MFTAHILETGDSMSLKYRKLSSTGDYLFGFGNNCFYTDADAVGQAISTKLNMFQGDCWLNLDDGLPFFQEIAGSRDKDAIDLLIQTRIYDAPDVSSISSFTSSIDGETRKYSFTASVITTYGTTEEVNG
jgi:hypothetical protein